MWSSVSQHLKRSSLISSSSSCLSRRYIHSSNNNFSNLVSRSLQFSNGMEFGICGKKFGHLSESSVLARVGETVVHAVVNSASKTDSAEDFLPLTVDYRHRWYGQGMIPTGPRRREAPTDNETLASRFVDRAVRSLFPKGYTSEVQLLVTAHSMDGVNDPTVVAVNAASMALLQSKQPWNGPIGCVRVGEVNGELKVNPTVEEMEKSSLNLLYAGTATRTVMIEAGGKQISEKQMKEALSLAHEETTKLVQNQLNFIEGEGKSQHSYKLSPVYVPNEVKTYVKETFATQTNDLYSVSTSNDKIDRSAAEGKLRAEMILKTTTQFPHVGSLEIAMAVDSQMHDSFRYALLFPTNDTDVIRSDGRTLNQMRPLDALRSVLPVVHGSSYFSRGDTHVMATTTLGLNDSLREAIRVDGKAELAKEPFYLHYDFPPYCTGEVGLLAANRRMVGHGNLAEKAVDAVMPSFEEFPYAVRVFAECTSSNGSSSMASACAASISLLDAGVPLAAPVAGVSVGLMTVPEFSKYDAKMEDNWRGLKYRLLKDILGSEDHHGDMDFKVAGTKTGITAIQLDVKLPGGVPLDILKDAIDVAREGRMEILDAMAPAIPASLQLPKNAPRAAFVKCNAEKLPQALEASHALRMHLLESGIEMNVDREEKTIYLSGTDPAIVETARRMVADLCTEIKEGSEIEATIVATKDYGAVMRVNLSQMALLHMSDLVKDTAECHPKSLEDALPLGHRMRVYVKSVDERTGVIRVSRTKLAPTDETLSTLELLPPEEIITSSATDMMGSFPLTPPKPWSADYFRLNTVPADDVKNAISGRADDLMMQQLSHVQNQDQMNFMRSKSPRDGYSKQNKTWERKQQYGDGQKNNYKNGKQYNKDRSTNQKNHQQGNKPTPNNTPSITPSTPALTLDTPSAPPTSE